MKGDEKPVNVLIRDGFLETNDMKYKLFEAGGRAFAFNEERAWVHFKILQFWMMELYHLSWRLIVQFLDICAKKNNLWKYLKYFLII